MYIPLLDHQRAPIALLVRFRLFRRPQALFNASVVLQDRLLLSLAHHHVRLVQQVPSPLSLVLQLAKIVSRALILVPERVSAQVVLLGPML